MVGIVGQEFHAGAVLTTGGDPGPTPTDRAGWGSSPMVPSAAATEDGAMSSIRTVRRSAADTKVAGLCGGVAEHWGIDPVLVRVGWVLLALSGGVGVVLYLAGWLLLPLAGQTRAPADDLLGEGVRRWPKGVWIVLVAGACLIVLGTVGALTPFGIGPALVAAAIWYFGFYRSRSAKPASSSMNAPAPLPVAPPVPPTPFTEAAAAWRRRVEEHTQQHGLPVPTTTAAPVPTWPVMPIAGSSVQDPDPELAARTAFLAEPDPVGIYASAAGRPEADDAVATPPRRGGDRLAARRLRLSCLALLGLALTGLALADQSGVAVTASVYAATALLVVGLTLVAATWLGRARGLLPLGLLLVPVVLATTVTGPVTHLDQWSAARHSYTQLSQLPADGDSQRAGELVIDLSHLPTTKDASYTAHVGTGRLEVIAPPGANVVVDYRVNLGEVEVGDQTVTSGSGGTGTATLSPPGRSAGTASTLTLHLFVDLGQLKVRR